MNKNQHLKNMLKEHIGATRQETVDFIWTYLASKNVRLDMDNKETVQARGKEEYSELLKDW